MKTTGRSLWKYLCLALLILPISALPQAEPAAGEQMPVSGQIVEVVFVLDTTGSMTGLIEGAKRKIWSIANAIVDQNPDAAIRIGLVGYRDIGDDYVTRVYPLTTDIQGIYGKLLDFRANGGGDTPESVNEALDAALLKQGWTPSGAGRVSRVIFLVGDAPPHMDYPQDRKYPEIIREARQKSIIVNAVQAGDLSQTRKIWQEIARLGAGEYIAIPQDGGRIVVIETPYDEEIIIIQRKLNTTLIPYGKREVQAEVDIKKRSYEAAAPSVAADMSGFVNKSGKGRAVITGAGDLIADFNEGKAKLDKIPAAELPENMRGMTFTEKQAYIAEQTQKRDELARELAQKVSQRDAFVKTEEAKKPAGKEGDSFDREVSKTLKTQIK
ncbi:MAG: VWA domain-containing protein [Azoarcus sp.]|jgi:Mg-chelatase subunit ChlD|nr:VWA domain-containing protein [Azoarcus sp.]